MLEIKFKKIHPDAQLPTRKHGNREINHYEQKWLEEANKQFEQQDPQAFKDGYRIGFPPEIDSEGNPTNNILGTSDTGYDIFCVEDKIIPAKGSAVVETGIEVAYISPGYWCRIEARSGLGFKHGIQPHPGIIDNGYTGNLNVKLYNFSNIDYNVKSGDRIAQLVFYPIIGVKIEWTDIKNTTHRGDNGFGSSGK